MILKLAEPLRGVGQKCLHEHTLYRKGLNVHVWDTSAVLRVQKQDDHKCTFHFSYWAAILNLVHIEENTCLKSTL